MTTPDGCICIYEEHADGTYSRTAHKDCKAKHSSLEWKESDNPSAHHWWVNGARNEKRCVPTWCWQHVNEACAQDLAYIWYRDVDRPRDVRWPIKLTIQDFDGNETHWDVSCSYVPQFEAVKRKQCPG